MNKQQTLLILFFVIAFIFSRAPKKDYGDCLAIKAGRIFNGVSDQYLLNKTILIQSGVIVSISDEFKPPTNCRIVNANKFTLIPGLIDAHTHLLLGSRDFKSHLEQIIQKALAMKLLDRLEMGVENARTMILSGFTTARDLGNSGHFLDQELQSLIDKNPTSGPRLIISGPGLAVLPSQAGKVTDEYRVINNLEAAKVAIDENVQRKIGWLKVYADNDPQPGDMEEELLKNIISEAHAAHLKVAVHTTEAKGALQSLQSGADSLEHFFEFPSDVDQATPKSSVVLTDFSLKVCQDYRRFSDDSLYQNCFALLQKRAARTQWALKNDFNLVFGSDSYIDSDQSRGHSAIEALISLEEEGLSPFQALQSAGVNAAKMLGEINLGEINPDKTADLVAVEGDPLKTLQDLKKIRFVIKQGKIVCQSEDSCRNP